MSHSLAIIDYGMGNLHSVAKAVGNVSPATKVFVTDDEKQIRSADRIIFPGVGAIRDCMAEIRKRHLDSLVTELCTQKPLLAVCVGMQALMTHSEENGGVDCLNILPGKVKLFSGAAFAGKEKLKVPHMGWNRVEQKISHPLWKGITQNERCYFVHSYYVHAEKPEQLAASTEYGFTFASALSHENIFAVQFHPEKSHRVGLQLLQNFANWDGQGS